MKGVNVKSMKTDIGKLILAVLTIHALIVATWLIVCKLAKFNLL